MDIITGLNPAQKQAVETLTGPVLILAGAGSGKTKTLTHRIANLINHGTQPDRILAVTFTNKAANEMRDRLWHILENPSLSSVAPRSFMPFMGTFHSICVKILRAEHSALNLPYDFTIYDTEDQLTLIRRIAKNMGVERKTFKPKLVLNVIGDCKNHGQSPEEYADSVNYAYFKETAEIYHHYELEKIKAHALDFDDLLLKVVQLFHEHPEICQKWRAQFDHILVDEYQDTNHIQYQLIKLLVNENRNICVVGDDWQSIYSWRGADFTNILNFEKDFPGAAVFKLEQNYRSTGNILDASQKIINHNKTRTDKTLFTESGAGDQIVIRALRDETAEAEFVARQIQQLNLPYSDFAILYRTNAQSYAFEKVFATMQIPYKIIGGMRFYDRREVKDVLAILHLLANRDDHVSLERVVHEVLSGIGDASLQKILDFLNLNPTSTLDDAILMSKLVPKARAAMIKLAHFIQTTDLAITPAEIIRAAVDYFDFERIFCDGTEDGDARMANIAVLIDIASEYNNLDDFLADASLASSVDEKSDATSVTLMTMHAAKGLEFPVVFLVGWEEGLFPMSRAENEQGGIEEERRLAYVGMTRAMKKLYISFANSRFNFGGRTWTEPSRFLNEIGYNPLTASLGADVDGDGIVDDILDDFPPDEIWTPDF